MKMKTVEVDIRVVQLVRSCKHIQPYVPRMIMQPAWMTTQRSCLNTNYLYLDTKGADTSFGKQEHQPNYACPEHNFEWFVYGVLAQSSTLLAY